MVGAAIFAPGLLEDGVFDEAIGTVQVHIIWNTVNQTLSGANQRGPPKGKAARVARLGPVLNSKLVPQASDGKRQKKEIMRRQQEPGPKGELTVNCKTIMYLI